MGVNERLTLWTALSVVAWGCSLWMLWRNEHRWRMTTSAMGAGVTWVNTARYVSSLLLAVAWIGIIVVGVLGFYPELAMYRSWAMLFAVVTLATYQILDTLAWEKIDRLAVRDRS
jgi:hypothetical protein